MVSARPEPFRALIEQALRSQEQPGGNVDATVAPLFRLEPRRALDPDPAHTPCRARAGSPPPRMVNFIDDDTHPGAFSSACDSVRTTHSGSTRSGSTRSGSQSDHYRLQLDFDDTPARPLPALATLEPLPLARDVLGEALGQARALAARGAALVDPRSVEEGPQLVEDLDVLELPYPREDTAAHAARSSQDLDLDLDDLGAIPDLDGIARALGLRGVADISIGSDEGAPLEFVPTSSPGSYGAEPPAHEAAAPAVAAASWVKPAEGDESAFVHTSAVIRPPPRTRPQVPVIVRIPSRPRVSAAARALARKLYLNALDELGRGDKAMAIDNLRYAVDTDDTEPLYKDLLAQLERGPKAKARSASASAGAQPRG